MGIDEFNPNTSYHGSMNYCCEVWFCKYKNGSPTQWMGCFKTLREAGEWIRQTGDPDHYRIKTINNVITTDSFTG